MVASFLKGLASGVAPPIMYTCSQWEALSFHPEPKLGERMICGGSL